LKFEIKRRLSDSAQPSCIEVTASSKAQRASQRDWYTYKLFNLSSKIGCKDSGIVRLGVNQLMVCISIVLRLERQVRINYPVLLRLRLEIHPSVGGEPLDSLILKCSV